MGSEMCIRDRNDSVLYQSIDKGKELFKIIPREIEEKLELI